VIELAHIADFAATIAAPIEIGARRLIPITGGEVRGPELQGRILAGGADFQLVRADGVAELHARYVIETSDGALIYVENSGLRYGPADAMDKIRRGEPVDPALIYCRTTPRFETSDPRYLWLTRHLFVASAVRYPDRVELAIYQIL
jgi:hypothetical protein